MQPGIDQQWVIGAHVVANTWNDLGNYMGHQSSRALYHLIHWEELLVFSHQQKCRRGERG